MGEDPFPWRPTAKGEDPFPLGDGDPFPLGFPPGGWVGTRGKYHAYQAGKFVYVHASAYAKFGTIVMLVSLNNSSVPVYGLGAFETESLIPALRLVETSASFYSKDTVDTVTIWDLDGQQTVHVMRIGP